MSINITTQINKILASGSLSDSNKLLKIKVLVAENQTMSESASSAKSIKQLIEEKIISINDDKTIETIIPSGFNSFDNSFGGFKKSEIVLIGARPGMGKSQLLINLALNMLAQSKSVLFHSLVLSESQMASRFLSSITTIPFIKVLMNDLTKTEKGILVQESNKFENYKLKLIDNSSSTIDWIAYYQNQIEENALEVIFIDDLNELFENKTKKELLIFTNSLIKLAEKNNVCIIASTQIYKKMEARNGEMKPRLSELIINHNLEQYSGKIISLYRPEYYGITSDESGYSVKNLAEILLLKNKSGGTGEVLIKRDENFTNFKDLASNKKEVHPSIAVQNIVENSNPAKNWANLGFLESQINNLNIGCNRAEILSEIGLIAPEKLGEDASQANAIQYFIQKMDIEMIETFLVRNLKD
jgi:replicative DNA helicase